LAILELSTKLFEKVSPQVLNTLNAIWIGSLLAL